MEKWCLTKLVLSSSPNVVLLPNKSIKHLMMPKHGIASYDNLIAFVLTTLGFTVKLVYMSHIIE